METFLFFLLGLAFVLIIMIAVYFFFEWYETLEHVGKGNVQIGGIFLLLAVPIYYFLDLLGHLFFNMVTSIF